MNESVDEGLVAPGAEPAKPVRQAISGRYLGQQGSQRLEVRVDLTEAGLEAAYQPLNLISGDFFRDVGGGEWGYRSSFIVEHPYATWGPEKVTIAGTMAYHRNLQATPSDESPASRPILQMSIPLPSNHRPPEPATVQIVHWGTHKTTFSCTKTSAFLRSIDLEIDRISGTQLPRPFNTFAVAERPPGLPALDLDILSAYRRAGIEMRIISDSEVFEAVEAGDNLTWDEDELHNAMKHHFSQWRDEPQWKLYLLLATHFRLYPQYLVTGIMYDSQSRDPKDPFPRQGAAAFYSSMKSAGAWGDLPPAEFERNYLRTCVHELGHALNLLHSFDKDRPESTSWMNYPWRYPYGYNLPPGWDGTHEYWQNCSFEFDAEEIRHLRHHALMEVIPGGAAFGASGHDQLPAMASAPEQQEAAAVALYVRTRPERTLFQFAEPVSVELKLKNQTQGPMVVPDMLNPEFGLLELFIRDPRGRVRPYQPLFKLCGEARPQELPPGEKLYESAFLTYGAGGFYFEEPGEYLIWAVYSAGGLRLRSNALRIRVAYPQSSEEEKIALWTFGQEQGHVLYMRGAEHLQAGSDQLREVVERFPATPLARYIHYCFGNSQAHQFKDVVSGKVRPVQLQEAAQQLTKASTLLRTTQRSALDNITHGRAVNLLYNCYRQLDEAEQAAQVLNKTVRYFKRMEVKQSVIDDMQQKIDALKR